MYKAHDKVTKRLFTMFSFNDFYFKMHPTRFTGNYLNKMQTIFEYISINIINNKLFSIAKYKDEKRKKR